jgi:hypothetical protein
MNNELALQTLDALRRVLGTNPQQLHEVMFHLLVNTLINLKKILQHILGLNMQ